MITDKRNLFSVVRALLLGMLPFGLCLLTQKILYAGQTDLLEPRPIGDAITQLFDPERYKLILTQAWVLIRFMPPWLLIILGVAVLIADGTRRNRQHVSTLMCIAAVVLLQAVGYGVIYLTTQLELIWLIDTTANRLTVQLWPSILFVCCLAFRAQRHDIRAHPLGG